MGKKKKWLLIILILFALLAVAVAVFGILVPYFGANTGMEPNSNVIMENQKDGRRLLSWTEAIHADQYRVEILEPGEAEPVLLYREFTEEPQLLLPPLPEGKTLILRLGAGVRFETLAGADTRYGEDVVEITACFDAPSLETVSWDINGDSKTVRVTTGREPGEQWQYQLVDADGEILDQQILSDPEAVLSFGADALAMPERGESHVLLLRARKEMGNLLLIGPEEEPVSISWESLQYRDLEPVLTETGKNTVTITWQATRGAGYEVQLLDGDTNTWNTVYQVSKDTERSYTSPWLEPGRSYCYRVAALDDENPGEYLILSGPLEYETKALTTYATVWPVMDLTAFSSWSGGNVAGTAKCGKAYCVLEERNGMFAVKIGENIGYINSSYCMINLPEYLGSLCSYDITNSYSSIYMIHDFGIENVTGVITAGYEDVYQENDTQLVPLIYPTAQKLMRAAKAARQEGYRLKIYDSFRPYIATRQIFDLTSLIMHLPVPDTTYDGRPASEMDLIGPGPGRDVLTYGWLMTGPQYGLNSFLAQVTSAHNLGIALDLTLEDLETGEEMAMQSAMHDLSHYSVLPKNNEAANLLGKLMMNAGFTGLISEWWHFQDNASRDSLGLPAVQYGINAECWVKDDIGWKYRTAKGGFYTAETVTISGTAYSFDEAGYVIS